MERFAGGARRLDFLPKRSNRPRQRGQSGDPGRRLGEAKAVNLEIRGGDLGRPRQPISAEARDATLSARPAKSGPGHGVNGHSLEIPK